MHITYISFLIIGFNFFASCRAFLWLNSTSTECTGTGIGLGTGAISLTLCHPAPTEVISASTAVHSSLWHPSPTGIISTSSVIPPGTWHPTPTFPQSCPTGAGTGLPTGGAWDHAPTQVTSVRTFTRTIGCHQSSAGMATQVLGSSSWVHQVGSTRLIAMTKIVSHCKDTEPTQEAGKCKSADCQLARGSTSGAVRYVGIGLQCLAGIVGLWIYVQLM